MICKHTGVESVEHMDRFFFWLESISFPANFRCGVALAVAEKLTLSFPELYDGSVYEIDS